MEDEEYMYIYICVCLLYSLSKYQQEKSCIRETKNLSTYAESRTDTILERLHDLSEGGRGTNKELGSDHVT